MPDSNHSWTPGSTGREKFWDAFRQAVKWGRGQDLFPPEVLGWGAGSMVGREPRLGLRCPGVAL